MEKCLYQHRRATDNEIFYVGIGTQERPFQKCGRNKHWHNVVEKHGYVIEILEDGLNPEIARELEIELIARYREDFPETMTNISDGGFLGPCVYGPDHWAYQGTYVLMNEELKAFIHKKTRQELVDLGFNVIFTQKSIDEGRTTTSPQFHIYDKKIQFTMGRGDKLVQQLISDGYIEINKNEFPCVPKKDFHTVKRPRGRRSGEGLFVNNTKSGKDNSNFKGFYIGISEKVIVFDGGKSAKERKFNFNKIRDCSLGRCNNTYKGFHWVRTSDVEMIKALIDGKSFFDAASENLLLGI